VAVDDSLPRQYWITNVGGDDSPVFKVTSERKTDDDSLVYLTDKQAKVYMEIHRLWLDAQAELGDAYFDDRVRVRPRASR
jgi:hypothetical protein